MPAISFSGLTFSCASTRWLGPYYNTYASIAGSFSANVKATITDTFDGASRTGIQIEGSRTNRSTYSQSIDSWAYGEVTVNSDTTDLTDPLGGNTAEEIVPSTNEAYHYAYIALATPAGDTYISTGCFLADGGYNTKINQSVGGEFYRNFQLSDFTLIDPVQNIDDEGVDMVGSTWGRCWTEFYKASPPQPYADFTICDGTSDYFTGDGSSSIYAWQHQTEYDRWLSSIIPTTSSEVTRAADNAYWAEGDVDSNLRGTITVYVIPQFSSEALYDADTKNTVLHFDDATQDIQIYFEKGSSADTGRIIVYGASALITTGDHTWSRGQLLKLVIDPASGEITTSLFTTGNDTHSGSSWSTDDGDVYIGQKSDNSEQFYGVIFEPEYEDGAVDHSAAMLGYIF